MATKLLSDVQDAVVKIIVAFGDDKELQDTYNSVEFADTHELVLPTSLRPAANARRQTYRISKRRGKNWCDPEFTPRLYSLLQQRPLPGQEDTDILDRLYIRANNMPSNPSNRTQQRNQTPPAARRTAPRATFARGTSGNSNRHTDDSSVDWSVDNANPEVAQDDLSQDFDGMQLNEDRVVPRRRRESTNNTPASNKKGVSGEVYSSDFGRRQMILGPDPLTGHFASFNSTGRTSDDGTKKLDALTIVLKLDDPEDYDKVILQVMPVLHFLF